MNRRDRIVSGSLSKSIVSLAVPVVLAMLMEFALSVTDFFWVGRLGAAAQDAITSSMVILWALMGLVSMISIGVTALVSRHVGSEEYGRAAYFIRQGLYLAAALAVVVSIVGYILTPQIQDFMGASAETQSMSVPYLRIFFIITIFFALTEPTYAAFRASGDTKTPTLIASGSVLLNIILDPILIFGWGPVPAYGVPGAAVATGISIVLAAVVTLTFMWKGKLGYEVRGFFVERPHLASMRRIARIGLPISAQQVGFVLVYWFLIKIVHEFGQEAGAAMGIGNRMESLSYLTTYGISVAASTMVGQNLGAGKPERAGRAAWAAVGIGVGFTAVISVFFLTIPEVIAGIFSDDPGVLRIAIDYLIILGLSQVAMAIEIILEGAFSGSGDTIPPLLVGLPGSVARIPLAYLLAFTLDWGINGVWWTLTITSLVKSVVLAYWFWLGRWKLKAV